MGFLFLNPRYKSALFCGVYVDLPFLYYFC